MSPLPDTHETAFEEVASALWAYTRYSEESWAGDRTGVDGVTHVLVNRRAEALLIRLGPFSDLAVRRFCLGTIFPKRG